VRLVLPEVPVGRSKGVLLLEDARYTNSLRRFARNGAVGRLRVMWSRKQAIIRWERPTAGGRAVVPATVTE
jgi:hypothetical protein